MNVKLHIDRLVLEGIPLSASQGAAVKAAMARELARLLRTHGIGGELQQSRMLSHIQAAGIDVRGSANHGALGRQIAQSVYRSVGKSGSVT